MNSTGAERLYTLAGDWASLGPDTLLFDVCCGTGTIGLTLAKRVGLVKGIYFVFLFWVALLRIYLGWRSIGDTSQNSWGILHCFGI